MHNISTNKKPLKVAIIGKLPSKYQAPFDDTSWQIYGCNVHSDFDKLPRFNLWFDIHKNISSYNENIRAKLITRDKYPLEKVLDLLGGNYLNNSISYMIMYAVLQGATEIALFGVRLDNDLENRTHQKNNVEQILFFCKGRGIKVWSYEPNILKEFPLYGA